MDETEREEGLNFKFDINVSITEQELQAIVKEVIEDNNPAYTVESINFKIGTQYQGFGPNERAVKVFDGADVKLKPKA